MKYTFVFLLLFSMFSCQKEKKKNSVIKAPPVVTVTNEGKIISIDSLLVSQIKDSLVQSFYRVNNYQTAWLDYNCRESLLRELQNVEEEGLNLNDFDIKKINEFEKSISTLSDNELIAYDILLTENLNRYNLKVAKGTLDPKTLYKDWDLKANKINFEKLLHRFLKKDSFDYALYQVKPNHLVYQKLKKSLKLLENFSDRPFPKLEIKDKIVLQDTNSLLPEIKNRLVYWGDMKKSDSLTSFYDENTLKGIKKFQLRHGLSPDGVIGKGTISALNFSKKKRKEQIIANMERWRWYPREFEKEYLLINIPDYTLVVIKNRDTIKTHRIIVGKASRSTPILSSKLSYVVFNPTWTLPPTILKEDVIPAATRNRSYFANKKITIYEGSTIVSAEDWNPSKARSYRYVQSPGANNSLGLVKIMFPNRFSVYLHDTNSRGYFGREIRSLSSGCVRVQDPFELTETLLQDSIQWNKQKIDSVLVNAKTKNVNFKQDIYLHLLYWTAWSEGNTLQFRDDIYNLDAALYQKLRN